MHNKDRFGLPTLTALVIGNMIGAGVFTTSGFALADLGSPHWVLLGWLVGGGIALCGALSYGGLARYFAESGGEYLFLARVIHPAVGFLAGWVSLLAGFTGAIAFAALAFESYLAYLFPAWWPAGSIAIGTILVFTILHSAQVSLGAISQNFIVALKLLLLAVFLSFAARGQSAAPPVTSAFSLTAFAGSLVWISLSYSGFNAAIYIAGEAREPAKTVPRAMWLGTIITMAFYLALNAVFVYLPPFQAVAGKEDLAAVAAQSIGGEGLALFVRAIIALALITSVSAMMMAGPRVYARMADDGIFPRLFQFRGDSPRAAIWLQAVLVMLVILLSSVKGLLTYLGFTLSLCAALTVTSLFVLRRREGSAVVVTGYPFTPALYVGATLLFAALAVKRNPWEVLGALLTIVSGLVVYYLSALSAARSKDQG
jgi:APA family basic amino acid/polyamine antiporter